MANKKHRKFKQFFSLLFCFFFFVSSELQPYNTYVNAYESVSQGAKTTKKHLECAAKRWRHQKRPSCRVSVSDWAKGWGRVRVRGRGSGNRRSNQINNYEPHETSQRGAVMRDLRLYRLRCRSEMISESERKNHLGHISRSCHSRGSSGSIGSDCGVGGGRLATSARLHTSRCCWDRAGFVVQWLRLLGNSKGGRMCRMLNAHYAYAACDTCACLASFVTHLRQWAIGPPVPPALQTALACNCWPRTQCSHLRVASVASSAGIMS